MEKDKKQATKRVSKKGINYKVLNSYLTEDSFDENYALISH